VENLAKRLQTIYGALGNYLVDPLPETLDQKAFVPLLCKGIEKAALNGISRRRNIAVLPLSIFTYSDGAHLMLTATVGLVEAANKTIYIDNLNQSGWNFLPRNWEDVTKIDIPNLTAKEQLFIEGLMGHRTVTEIHDELHFKFDKSTAKSIAILEEFLKHYQRYPQYLQVAI
jgi:hypothetical protein